MADDGRLAFDIVLMEDAFYKQAERIQESFKKIGESAVNEGRHIDDVFSKLLTDAPVATVEQRMNALLGAISKNEQAIGQLGNYIEELGEKAKKALAEEDYKGFRDYRESITRAQVEMAGLQAQTKDYKHILKEIEQAAGKVTAALPHDTARFFATEEDYNRAKELTTQIDELKSKLAEVDDQAERNTINAKIIDLQKELDGANKKATDAASALGDKLGGRAAEVSTRFYELNAAVKEQEQTLTTLKQNLADTEEKLNDAIENDDVEEVKNLQLQYQHLSEQVRNADDALSSLKGEQKDADNEWSAMSETIKGVEGNFGKFAGSLGQITIAFTSSKNPIQIFRASLTALKGGMKLVELGAGGIKGALQALWKVILANPITALTVGIAAAVAGIIALINSAKSATEKLKDMYEAQKDFNKLMQSRNEYNEGLQNNVIKADELRIAKLKAQHAAIKEIQDAEDQLNRDRLYYAQQNASNNSQYIKNLDKNRQAIYATEKEINRLKEIQRKEDNEDETVEYTINGKKLKEDADKAIEALQEFLESKKVAVELGVKYQFAEEEVKVDMEKAARERIEQNWKVQDVETSALRSAASVRIALMDDSYKQELANAKKASEERIADLKKSLNREENLTVKAKRAIEQQIADEREKLRQEELRLAYDHEKKIQQIQIETAQLRQSVGEKSYEEERQELTFKYSVDKSKISDQLENAKVLKLSKDEIAALQKQLDALTEREQKEMDLLLQKQKVARINFEKESIELRLESVRAGSDEELALRMQLLEKERKAEIEANKLRSTDEQVDVDDINAKYDKAGRDLMLSYDIDYQKWLSRLDNLTVKELERLLATESAALDNFTGTLTEEEQAEIDALIARIKELEDRIKSANLTPKEKDTEHWKKVASYVNELGGAFQDLGSAVGGATGEVVSFIGETISTVGSTITTVCDGIEKVGKETSDAIKAIETASVILAVISAAISVIRKLVDLFDSADEEQERLEEATKKYEETVHDLTRAFEQLNDAIDKAYGSDKAALIQEQIHLIEQELEANRENNDAIRKRYEELAKKKEYWDSLSGFEKVMNWGSSLRWSDEDEEEFEELEERLRDSNEEIEDLERKIKDLQQSMLDAIFGSDIQSAIENFADAYANAWQEGTDAAEASKDVVKDLMRSAILEATKMAIASTGAIEEIRNALVIALARSIGGDMGMDMMESLFGDSWIGRILSAATLASGSPEDAYNEVDNILERLNETLESLGLEGLYSRFGLDDASANGREAQAKGIATASQESVDELNGRMTAVQGHTFNISENSNVIRDNIAAINGNVNLIREYTQHLVRMDDDLRAMKNSVQSVITGNAVRMAGA